MTAGRRDAVALLFGSTRRRVLGWLLSHADDAFYLRELARQTGTAVGAAQRELEQLTAAGLVVREVRGARASPDLPNHALDNVPWIFGNGLHCNNSPVHDPNFIQM